MPNGWWLLSELIPFDYALFGELFFWKQIDFVNNIFAVSFFCRIFAVEKNVILYKKIEQYGYYKTGLLTESVNDTT